MITTIRDLDLDNRHALERLTEVQSRIAQACTGAERPVGSVTLLAVSKTFGADRVLQLATLGQRAFAENYLQEALEKIAAVRSVAPDLELAWHFIGPVQSNKTRPIAEQFDWVHSVDREKIGRRLAEQRPGDRAPLNICVQVNLSGEASKSGCKPDEALPLCRSLAGLEGLRLRGLMAIPAPGEAALQQDRPFEQLGALFATIQAGLTAEFPERSASFDTLSMGMSDDLEEAVAAGATIVRVGTALFGRRERAGDLRA
jgi:pyridoxal phosphate enzyme (YggS family)